MKNLQKFNTKYFVLLFLPVLFTALLVGSAPEKLSAQSLVQLSIITEPEFPKPNEEVEIRARSFSTDLDRAEFTWYLNGVLIKQGLGDKTFSFTAGRAGEVALVDVIIQTQEGRNLQRNVLINPAVVDLIWEAPNSSVPPLYRGKALFPREGELRVVAVPNLYNLSGEKISSNNLVYRWRVNGQNRANSSGVGRNVLTTAGPRLDGPIDISVEVSSLDESVKTRESIRVRSSNQRALFYENHPLYGALFETPLRGLPSPEETFSFIAFPMFFETDRGMSNLDFVWEANNQRQTNLDGSMVAAFQREGGITGGIANISVLITNMENSRQRTERDISLGL